MTYDTRNYARGTFLRVSYPWGWNVSGAAICSDGKVRKLKRIAETADTFFSIPASVTVDGRTVAGYVTVETERGYSTDMGETDPYIVKFVAYTYRKNGTLLPKGSWLHPSMPRPIAPEEIREGMTIARWPHLTFHRVASVRQYTYGATVWHEPAAGDSEQCRARGGFSFTYPAGTDIYMIPNAEETDK